MQRLTTNVTGHFALLVDEVFKLNFWQGFLYFLYIFFFFFGAFLSGILTELVARKNERLVYVVPVILESLILFLVGTFYPALAIKNPDIIAFSLLFAMGLQNSLVTTISNAVVRTTHLTGLFTDLGIELSQLSFYRTSDRRTKLISSIRLRLTIICFFFVGGIAGGFIYAKIDLHVLIVGSALLLVGLIYDSFKFRVIQLKRKHRSLGTGDL